VTPTPDPVARRNFRLGVLNGAIYQGGEGFVDASTVIPVLLSGLTRSNTLIGLGASLNDTGWLLPQIFVAPWASRHAQQLWLYRRATVVRASALVLLAALAWPLRDHPGGLLALFFACYGIYSFGAGFGAVAFMEVCGRVVPADRLGSFFSQRMFWGGLSAAFAGLAVRQLLGIESTALRLLVLFGLSSVVCSIAYVAFGSIQEPKAQAIPTAPTPRALLRQGLGWLRDDPLFRRLFLARASLGVWLTASPFMVLFAARDLGGGGGAAGTFLLARVSGFVVSNIGWQWLSRRHGDRAIMRFATGGACVLAFAAAIVSALSPWWLGVLTREASVIALEVITFFGGAAHSGLIVGYASLVIGVAPAGQRQAFVSLMNTFVGVPMLLPMVGGALVDLTNAPIVFALCGAASLIGVRAAWGLPESSTAPAEATRRVDPDDEAIARAEALSSDTPTGSPT
jgi:hypothetical protein